MMSHLVLVTCLLAAAPSIEDRMGILQSHFDRLAVIEVTSDAQSEATAALEEISALLKSTPETPEAVDRIYERMDEVRTWLLAHAEDRPTMPVGEFRESQTEWSVSHASLSLTITKKDLSMAVQTPGGSWQWQPSDAEDVTLRDGRAFSLASARDRQAEAFNTGFSVGMRIRLKSFKAAPEARIDILAHIIGKEIVFEIVAVEDIPNLSIFAFPKSLVTGNSETDVAVISRMQGMMLPGNWHQEIQYRNLTQSRELYMPWWGQIASGRGVQTILETPHDGGVDYKHPAGGPTRIQPLWYSSMNRLRYPRIVRYVFDDEATYVKMAKRYRRFVKEKGLFVSLAEKRVRTPNLDKVIGKPVVHIGALYHRVEGARGFRSERMELNHRLTTFEEVADALRGLKDKGIEQAYVHLDGWGYRGYDNSHPDVIPPGPEQGGWEGLRSLADTCDELDYLLAVHDQYRDFYFCAVSFDDKLAIHNWDGSRTEHAEWAGGDQTFLSPRFAPDYVRRNHDAFAAHGIKIRGAYLDVFAVVPLEESFQPSHPITRTDCAKYRAECFDLLRARGYVVSSEEPADYLIRTIDMVHHGPYTTLPKGYGFGEGAGIAVPLFNLVYHDSILIPWYLAESGGWGIARHESGYLHCVLNAGLPYVAPNYSDEQIARVKEVAELAGRLGTLEMTNHEFLDDARRRQRATYSDGTQVTIDFDKGIYDVTAPGR